MSGKKNRYFGLDRIRNRLSEQIAQDGNTAEQGNPGDTLLLVLSEQTADDYGLPVFDHNRSLRGTFLRIHGIIGEIG